MHCIENFLVHNVNIQGKLFSKLGHSCDKLGKIPVEPRNIHHHNHCEHILQNALGNLDHVCVVFCAYAADLSENTYRILSYYSNNRPHLLINPFVRPARKTALRGTEIKKTKISETTAY